MVAAGGMTARPGASADRYARRYYRSGRLPSHGCAASNAAAACNTPRSSNRLPTICNPTGNPSAVNPHGTLAAGFHDMLNG